MLANGTTAIDGLSGIARRAADAPAAAAPGCDCAASPTSSAYPEKFTGAEPEGGGRGVNV